MPGPVATNRGGAGAPSQAPAPGFTLLELHLIHKGNLVARCSLEMPSGMRLVCNIMRSKKDSNNFFIGPLAERTPYGWSPIVTFATPALGRAWQAAALAALKPRWAELTEPTGEVSHGFTGF